MLVTSLFMHGVCYTKESNFCSVWGLPEKNLEPQSLLMTVIIRLIEKYIITSIIVLSASTMYGFIS